MATTAGLEPAISTVTGWRHKPLDHAVIYKVSRHFTPLRAGASTDLYRNTSEIRIVCRMYSNLRSMALC